MNISKKRLVWLASLLSGAMILAACGGDGSTGKTDSTAPESPRKGSDSMVLIASADPGNLNYITNNQTALQTWIPDNVIEPLLTFSADGKTGPGIADSWTVSKDKKTYVFHIRNASFSNGEPVTSADVVYSMEKMRDSTVGPNKAPYAAVQDIKALGDSSVRVRLKRPSLGFFRGMSDLAGSVGSKASAASIETKPVGTGPYMVQEYVPDQHIVFTANPHYWGKKPAISKVELRFVPDGTTALNALKVVDLLYGLLDPRIRVAS